MPENIRDIAEKPPEEIRQEIDETRSSIASKLEALEEQVVGTVQNAKESVEETINTVKETVQETVSTVKETFDLRLQVERHPWPVMGGSLAAGLITGVLLGEVRHRRQMPMDRLVSDGEPMTESYRAEPPTRFVEEPREPGLFDRFQGEITQLKGLALGMLFGMVRDVIKENVSAPEVAAKIGEVMDNITAKLGGQPVRGPVFAGQGERNADNPHRIRATVA
jgi:ElaB/YqjD/DUF883 family membrane-anchored ribosome-binding protein